MGGGRCGVGCSFVLGFSAGGFFSMEQAKGKAGEFAKAVLMGMVDLID